MKIHGELNQTKKFDSSATVFVNKVKAMAYTLASIVQPFRSEEFTGIMCQGVDSEHDTLIQGFSLTPCLSETCMLNYLLRSSTSSPNIPSLA
jgi:hypothetical protein